jgi:hypothetical protein
MGRPAVWEDPEAFDKAVDEYFDLRREEKEPPTWTGLALHLGFESRQSLQDYKEKEGFSYPIKKALARIEDTYEKALFNKNAAGPIFALKNFNWKDKQEIAHDHTIHKGFVNIDPLDDNQTNDSPTQDSATKEA